MPLFESAFEAASAVHEYFIAADAAHMAALAALQEAERDYHRTIAGSAFTAPAEGPSPVEMQKDSLKAVETARLRLDDVRARRPE